MEDRELKLISGWAAMAGVFLALAVLILIIVLAISSQSPAFLWIIIPLALAWVFGLFGFIVNGPNMARVVLLFGEYKGTVKDVGFFYGNPLYYRSKISLRIRSLETGVTTTEERRNAAGQVTQQTSQQRKPLKVTTRTARRSRSLRLWSGEGQCGPGHVQVDDYGARAHAADVAPRNLTSRYSYDAPEGDEHFPRTH